MHKNITCANCGIQGHIVKECESPVTSFGIIAFKVVFNKDQEKNDKNDYLQSISKDTESEYPKIKYLLIQRKDTMGYVDFIRGKYKPDDLTILLNEMTITEKEKILTSTFKKLWDDMWVNKKSNLYIKEYSNALRKFENLDISTILKSITPVYSHTEFSFPKGRRNVKESDIACAKREFSEETGFEDKDYDFIKNYPIVEESFIGTNKVHYKHIYYIVKAKEDVHPPVVDTNNNIQIGEVSNVGWFTLDECITLFRPYDQAKKNILKTINKDLLDMNFRFNCQPFFSRQSKWSSYKK